MLCATALLYRESGGVSASVHALRDTPPLNMIDSDQCKQCASVASDR